MRKQCKKCSRIYHQSVNQCIFDNSVLEEYPVYGICPICGEVIGSSRFCFNDGTVINLKPPLEEEILGMVVGQKYLIEKFLETTPLFHSYLGENVKTGDKVTIKVIHPRFITCQDEYDKYTNLTQKTLQIKDENILATLDYFIEQQIGLHCLITESHPQFISLESILKEEPTLSNNYKLSLLKQICSGLNVISKEKIYPLTVCPGDIMILREKNKEIVKINPHLILPEPLSVVSCDSPRYINIRGYQYCAPEAFLPERLSEKSIIYNFGVLIYYLLTYKFPYTDKPYSRFVVEMMSHKITPLRVRTRNVTPEVETLVLRMLSQKAEERPSFSQMTNLLEEAWQSFDSKEYKNHLEAQKDFPQHNELISNNSTTQALPSNKTIEKKTDSSSEDISPKNNSINQKTKKSDSLFDHIKKLFGY